MYAEIGRRGLIQREMHKIFKSGALPHAGARFFESFAALAVQQIKTSEICSAAHRCLLSRLETIFPDIEIVDPSSAFTVEYINFALSGSCKDNFLRYASSALMYFLILKTAVRQLKNMFRYSQTADGQVSWRPPFGSATSAHIHLLSSINILILICGGCGQQAELIEISFSTWPAIGFRPHLLGDASINGTAN